jgi:hypothetical protein
MGLKTITLCAMACASLALPFGASAQSSDAKYCRALMDAYRNLNSSNQPNVEIPIAMNKCESGSDPAGAVAIFEKALKNARVTLPPRE